MSRSVRLIVSLLLLALLIPPMAVQAYKPRCCGQSECYSCCELLSHVADGYCITNYYNRCDNMQCGDYDPSADDCQYYCEWDVYECQCSCPPVYWYGECLEYGTHREACFTQ